MPPSPNLDEVLRYMGADRSDPQLVELAQKAVTELSKAITPKYIYRKFDIQATDSGIRLSGTDMLLTGHAIAAHLKGCHACYLLAGTLGAQADRVIRLATLKSMLEGLALNSAATELTENLMDTAQQEIGQAEAEKENYLTDRFSPGYGDLPISLQKELLFLCDTPRKIGLSVTENDILTPKKSVTAIIGISHQPTSQKIKGCAFCNMRERCTFRKAGTTCGH